MRTDELRQGLHALAESQPATDPTAARADVARRHRRHQTMRGAVAAACLVVVALVGWSLAGGDAEQGLDVSGTGEPAPGMLVPDLTPTPIEDVSARVLTGTDVSSTDQPSQVWLWSTDAEPVPAPSVPEAEDLTRPLVLLTVWPGPTGGERPLAEVPAADGMEAWTRSWSDAHAIVLGRGVPTDELVALLEDLPDVGFDASALPAPAGLQVRLAGDRYDEALPGVLAPSPGGVPAHQLRVRQPSGDTLWVVSGDPVLVDVNLLLVNPGEQITTGTVRGEPGWEISPVVAATPEMRVLLWNEGGRGYALALTGPDGRSRTPDELFAAAEALRPMGPAEWQALVDRTTGGTGSVDTMIATVEGQGTPIDPVTGEPLP